MCGIIVTFSKGKMAIIQSDDNDNNDSDGQWKFQKVTVVNNRICFNTKIRRVNLEKGGLIVYSLDEWIVYTISDNTLKTGLKQLPHGFYIIKNTDSGKLSKYVTEIFVYNCPYNSKLLFLYPKPKILVTQ